MKSLRSYRLFATLFAILSLISSAQAIIFSNVSMTFSPVSLGTGSFFTTGVNDIDFFTPEFKVGDFSFGPARSGSLTVKYDAESTVAMMSDRLTLAILAGLGGSGQIVVSETIEDLINPGVIGQLAPTVISSAAQLPFVADINFSRATTKIRATKVIEIIANPDTSSLDFARVGLIEQSIGTVPEPGTMVALTIGAVSLLRRRRK